jgi:predicted AAA+ superfamily ATPase
LFLLTDTIRFSLKPAPTIFYRREELVDNITRLILSGRAASDAARIAIMGSGGMGKTSVALAVIHDSRIVDVFGDNRHWVPCDKAHTIPLLLEYLA